MACRQLVKPSTLCLHLSSTLFVRILSSTRYIHPLYLYPLSLQSIPCTILIIYVCVSWGAPVQISVMWDRKTVAGGRKMCCSVCYNGLPLLSLLARMAALADACAQYGWCACCAFNLPNAVCRYSVDKLRVCLHS